MTDEGILDNNTHYEVDSNGNIVHNPDVVNTDELNGGVTGSLAVNNIYGERIESQPPSGVSNASFTSGINSDYPVYVLHFTNLIPASDNVPLHFRVREGGSWVSGASTYAWDLTEQSGGTETVNNSTGDGKILLTNSGVGSASGEQASGWVKIYGPSNSNTFTTIEYHTRFIGDEGNLRVVEGGGRRTGTAAQDGLRIFFDTGSTNIESGKVALSGVMG